MYNRIVGYKRYFSRKLYERIKAEMALASVGYPSENFLSNRISGKMSIRDRCFHIANALEVGFKSQGHRPNLDEWKKFFGPELKSSKGMFTEGYWLMPISCWIELYLADEVNFAFDLMYELTKRHTAEYCIRPFIKRDYSYSIKVLKKWTSDSNEHVRRLASEGLRPRLPWADQIVFTNAQLKKNCEVLYKLRKDQSIYVRKSVANHIRDIQKVTPQIASEFIRSLNSESEGEKWILNYLNKKPVRLKHRSNL